MYKDQEHFFEDLTDVEAGQLIKAVFKFSFHGEKTNLDSKMLNILLKTLSAQINRDMEKYAKKCEKLRKNGRKGGEANATNWNQTEANGSLNDNVNDNVNVNDNDKYRKPTADEVLDFAQEYCNTNPLLPYNEVLSKCNDAVIYYDNLMHSDSNCWYDSNEKLIKNWKLKFKRVWLKDIEPIKSINIDPMNVC
tara:strand:+ start:1477 stop:2055 length:579 start_codon:yes stop_codon:yes gene_type:complete